jgi:anti-sigma regulatory factor (Ser/Thr protein kinase)
VRRVVAAWLAGCPAADDAVLIASELATNAILHSLSRGRSFTVRCHVFPGYLLIEVEDLGGPWRPRKHDRPHGLDVIEGLAGAGNWGRGPADGEGTIAWARLGIPAEEKGRARRA